MTTFQVNTGELKQSAEDTDPIKYKKLDAEELIDIQFSESEFIDLLQSIVKSLYNENTENDEEIEEYIALELSSEIAKTIVSFLRIPNTISVKIDNELWVRMDSKNFKRNVGYLCACYPWTKQGRKILYNIDAYLESLELWHRYRVKDDYFFMSSPNSEILLTDKQLGFWKKIISNIGNRASMKYSTKSDLITMYNSYNLFNTGVASDDVIICPMIEEQEFESQWEMYGDNVSQLSTSLTNEAVDEWRKCSENICHLKENLLPEIMQALYPADVSDCKVRRIHLSTDILPNRDRTKYLYDLYVGVEAVLFQRVHSE